MINCVPSLEIIDTEMYSEETVSLISVIVLVIDLLPVSYAL
jgi:hypothetical protein